MYLPLLPVFESVVFISCCSLLDPFIICLFITTKMQKLTAEPIGCAGDKTSFVDLWSYRSPQNKLPHAGQLASGACMHWSARRNETSHGFYCSDEALNKFAVNSQNNITLCFNSLQTSAWLHGFNCLQEPSGRYMFCNKQTAPNARQLLNTSFYFYTNAFSRALIASSTAQSRLLSVVLEIQLQTNKN